MINLWGLVAKVLVWILRSCKGSEALRPRELEPLLTFFRVSFQTRGLKGGLLIVKATRGNVLNFLSGSSERIPGVALRRSGLPRALGPLAVKLEQGKVPILGLRLLLTVLFASRALSGKAQPDIEAIEGPSDRCVSSLHIGMKAVLFWKALGYQHSGSIPRALRWRRFHFTTRTGPNGQGLSSWILDLYSLPNQLREHIKFLGGVKFSSFIDEVLSDNQVFFDLLPYKLMAKVVLYSRR